MAYNCYVLTNTLLAGRRKRLVFGSLAPPIAGGTCIDKGILADKWAFRDTLVDDAKLNVKAAASDKLPRGVHLSPPAPPPSLLSR